MKFSLHKHPKDATSKPEPQTEGTYIVEGVSGPAQGKVVTVGTEPVSVNDRFSVQEKYGRILARSLTEKELYISGEFIHEAILQDGDMIVTQDSEFRFRFKPANEEASSRRKQNIIRAALILLVLFIILPVIAPKLTPWPALFSRTEVKEALTETTHAFDTGPKPELAFGENPSSPSSADTDSKQKADKKVTDPAEVSRMVAMARMRYEIAQSYAQQGGLFAGHLFWAIQELKEISRTLKNIDPQPDLLPVVNKQITQYQEALDNHLKHLHVQAIIASRLGEEQRYTDIVKEIEYVSQYQGASAFEWAAKALEEAKSN